MNKLPTSISLPLPYHSLQ